MKKKILAGIYVTVLLLLLSGVITSIFMILGRPTNMYIVENESMMPNLLVKQKIVVEEIPDGQIRRGDIVLCEIFGNDQIKRIIGLPGETVKIKDGNV